MEVVKTDHEDYIPYKVKGARASFLDSLTSEQIWINRDLMKPNGYSVLMGKEPLDGRLISSDEGLNKLRLNYNSLYF